MPCRGKSTFWLRLCIVGSFVCYLFAGASLALPPKQDGRHCAMSHAEEKPEALKPGASCPLAHNNTQHNTQHGSHHSQHDAHGNAQQHAQHESQRDSQHGHDCDACHGSHSAEQIVMCPHGCCLLHPDGGEVTSLAKFLLHPAVGLVSGKTFEHVSELASTKVLEPFLAPPEHPPSVFLFA